MYTNSDCTIYNRTILSGAETYQRTQILGVEWENKKAGNVIKSGLIAADQASIYIPYARGTNYLASKAWQALTSKTGKFTFQVGDYIVKGLVTDEIHEAIAYSAGPPVVAAVAAFMITDLKKKYDDVLQIKSVDFRDFGSIAMWHWELGAG